MAVSPAQVNLTWTASTDNVAVSGYTVFRDGAQVGVTTAPSFADTGLARATTYAYTVSARDAAGNTSALSAPVIATTPAFAISGIGSGAITATSAVIAWTTDQLTTSQVEYGPTSSYGAATPIDATLTTGHSVNLTGLLQNSTYHYRVISRDAAGHSIASGDNVFTTPQPAAAAASRTRSCSPGSTSPRRSSFWRTATCWYSSWEAGSGRSTPPPGPSTPTDFLSLTNIGTRAGSRG